MRKEQILLAAAAVIGALLVWSATGKYAEVGAASLPAGGRVDLVASRTPDPVKDLAKDALKGRAPWAVVRSEKRPPLPDIPAPAALPIPYVRPVPTPGPSPEHLRKLRTQIVPVAKEKKEDDTGAAPAPGGGEQPGATEPEAAPQLFSKAKKFNPAKAAKVVRAGGEEQPAILEPTGPFKGQPDWVILEKWPNVQFKVSWLNTNGTVMGDTVVGPAEIQGYKTVHLKPTLDNCFWEEWITRGVRENDRDALTRFAQWCVDTLRTMSGDDEVPFGIGAVRKAIEVLEKARAINADVGLIRTLGSYYRAAYDFDGELRCYLAYLKEHPTETAAQLLVGDAYERMGCAADARALYENAAKTGDAESRLRVGLMLEREGDLAGATQTLTAIAATGGVAGRANLALARIAIVQGDFAAAASYAEQAKKEPSPALNQVLGSLLYVQGKFADAASTFAAAKEDEISSVWRSNRGLALMAGGDLDGASKEFQTCLDTDPLNLLDPLFGLGEAFQRKAEPDRSSNYYETALARSPNDPEILLRVGTLRLRDGQAEKALAMGLHLLEVAPGCNEGLWLVGRAAASLDKPDWDKATTYLRRACEKERDNADFLFEFGRVLVLAGRVDEAIKVLDEATDVRSGYARTDGRLVGLLAWARFLGKRPMEEVNHDIQRARTAVLDDAAKEWISAVKVILDEWEATRIWVDDFNRPASGRVGNGWEERDEAHGITAGVNADHLVFASPNVKDAAATREGATRVFRSQDLDLGRVKEVEASFKTQMGVETVFHIYVGALADRVGASAPGSRGGRGGGGAELGLGCDRNGKMILWLVPPPGKSGQDKSPEFQVKDAAGNPRDFPKDEFHTVRFVRKEAVKGIWEVWLDDERILGPDGKPTFEIGALGRQPGKPFSMGFLVDADSGSTVAVEAEYVKVTKTNK